MYENTLSDFLKTIQNHDWVTHSHICIYTAILELWHQNNFANPVPISRHKIMGMSKVSAIATYHKWILRPIVYHSFQSKVYQRFSP